MSEDIIEELCSSYLNDGQDRFKTAGFSPNDFVNCLVNGSICMMLEAGAEKEVFIEMVSSHWDGIKERRGCQKS